MSVPATRGRGVRRVRVRVAGVVQGVGFRPFVHALAAGLGLAGFVGNDSRGVVVEVEGEVETVAAFLRRLPSEAPELAIVEDVEVCDLPATGASGFAILASRTGSGSEVLVSPDVATCRDCLREIGDPGDRRYRYAFTNCTACGPRYTIVRDVPYDRPRTTMAGFAMCEACAREYGDPADRRFHAQPTCCPACGPRLRLVTCGGREVCGDPMDQTARLLRDGAVVAVKGLGGYHLAADAASEEAAAALRARKHREDKPFAVMVADVDAARRLCQVSAAEAELRTSPAAPIVLLRRSPGAPVARAVAPGDRAVGVPAPRARRRR